MDVSKFTLDRNAYLNTAAAIYESTKQQVSSNYSAYLDPSVLTKAYFDSKMYSDRASGAPNYAFDISKIYGSQSGSSMDMNCSQDRDSTPQLDDKSMNETGNGGHMDFNGNGTQASYQTFASQQQQQQQQPNIKFEPEQTPQPSQQPQPGGSGSSAGGGDYRRPLTVIF